MANKLYLRIEADYNDGDYLEDFKEITLKEFKKLLPIIKIIKANNHSWPRAERGSLKDVYSNKLTEEQIKFFDEYVPNDYDNGPYVHTICTFDIYTVTNKKSFI